MESSNKDVKELLRHTARVKVAWAAIAEAYEDGGNPTADEIQQMHRAIGVLDVFERPVRRVMLSQADQCHLK